MKKISDKLLKIIMLISMIFSSLQTPIYVLADELSSTSSDGSTPTLEKGDMKLGIDGEVTKTGTVSTISESTDGKISVKKTVTKDETVEGRFKVDFEIVGKESEKSTPVYVVLVFDRSGSMCDINKYNSCTNMTKWDNATQAAYDFSKIIIDNIPSSKIALVTFSTNASKDRDFEHKYLGSDTDKSIFGTANGGTNLHDGLIKARSYLSASSIPEGAKKYVVVMSDGQPTYYMVEKYSYTGRYYEVAGSGNSTSTNMLNATLKEAKSIKDSGTEIYSIGYSLSEDNILNNYKYDSNKDFTNYSNWKAKDVLINVASTDMDTSKDAISHYQDASNSDKIKDAFEKIAKNIVLPGKEAVLTDNIGNNFKFVSQLDNSVGGTNSTSNSNGFGGTYISNEITEITKNSIKFSFNIDIDKDSPTGWYQTNNGFNLVYKDNNGNEQTIKSDKDPYVYWVQNEYDYIVNYYKDEISGTPFKSDTRTAPKGTVINESNVLKDKYLSEAGVSYEYKSISPESITITNDGETKVINVLYVKAYGTLKVSYVDTEGKDLLPSKSETKEVGTDYEEKALLIYGYTLNRTTGIEKGKYVKGTTEIIYEYTKNSGSTPKNEVVKSQTNAILGANSTFKYTLTYNGEIENYVGDATLTLTDILPYDVESISYDTENCSFDVSTRTLTCTKTYDINEQNRVINEVFTFEVVYKGLVSELELNVKNEVNSKLTFGNTNVEDNSEVIDVVKIGTVITKYVDEAGKELADSETTTGLGDTEYTTSEKTIYGYTLKGQPENKNGKYVANETIEVIYVYSKNAGKVTENNVTKTGPENITSVNGKFNYTLTYNGKIEDYVGKATLTLTDTLPYELENGSKYEGCTYSNKVLTCVKEFDIDKEHQEVSAKFDLELVFKDVNSDKVVNKVDSLLTYGNNNKKDDDETETEVFKGTVIAKYVDETGEELADSVTKTGLGDTEYTTSEKTIYGYTLKGQPENKTGKYVANETIEVIYVYSKNAGSAESEVVKTQTNAILGANSTFKYTLTYNGEIENYVGDATLTLTDILPYDVESISYDTENCSFDVSTRTLTCTKTYDITETNRVINEVFTFEVVYKGLVSELELNVKNEVNSKLTFGEIEVPSHGETTDKVLIGTVVAKYVDEAGNKLADEETSTGLGDTEYTTSEKTIYGYTLKGQPENKNGKYVANETIEVIYVYTKNAGEVIENEVTKTGPENITSVNGTFNYTLTYNGKIEDYVGKATLTLTDILPYELENGSKYDGCTYSNKVLTCVKEFDIDKEHQEVSAKFDLELVFKDVNSDKIVNKVDSLLTYGNNNKKDDDETETEVFKGTVISKYVDEAGKELADSVTSIGLGDTEYKTNEKTIYGYTLTEDPENKNGSYIANETIYVIYVYTKNAGKVTENDVLKTGQENITSVNGIFNYTLTYNGKIEDYVGSATLTLTDTLPYELENGSEYEGCTYSNKVLTCVKEFDIDEEHQEVSAKFDLELVFKDVDSNIVVNKVDSLLTYGNNNEPGTSETETEVFKGTVVAIYKNRDGELLNKNIVSTGLAGSDYDTEELEFLGYTLTKLPENKSGKYVANQTTTVVYIYDKNVGTSEEHLEKTGFEMVDGVDSAFEYKITYNLEVFDYVGDVNITLTDYLPFDIDLDKSDLGNVCKYNNGLLICEYKHTINSKEDSVINIEENLVLYYKDIDTNKVVNRIESLVVYGDEKKFDEDEFITEIPYGQIKVNYVTEDGKELSSSEISIGLVGADYKTNEKYFDDYYLKEVIGNEEGKYETEEQEITYVYSEIPLPPQTGINSNNVDYLGILVFAIVVLIIKKRYA